MVKLQLNHLIEVIEENLNDVQG